MINCRYHTRGRGETPHFYSETQTKNMLFGTDYDIYMNKK